MTQSGKLPSMACGDDDFEELVWKNGHVVSRRWSGKLSCFSFSDPDYNPEAETCNRSDRDSFKYSTMKTEFGPVQFQDALVPTWHDDIDDLHESFPRLSHVNEKGTSVSCTGMSCSATDMSHTRQQNPIEDPLSSRCMPMFVSPATNHVDLQMNHVILDENCAINHSSSMRCNEVNNSTKNQPTASVLAPMEIEQTNKIGFEEAGNSLKEKHETGKSTHCIARQNSVCSLEASNNPIHDQSHNQNIARRRILTRGNIKKGKRKPHVHNLSERKRRDKISKKILALQNLIPKSSKVDKASILDDAIQYLKALQLQLQMQMMSIGSGIYIPQQMMLPPRIMQYMNPPNVPQFTPMSAMGPMNTMRMPLGLPPFFSNSAPSMVAALPNNHPHLQMLPLASMPSRAVPSSIVPLQLMACASLSSLNNKVIAHNNI